MERVPKILRHVAGCAAVLVAVGAGLVAVVPQGSASSPAVPAAVSASAPSTSTTLAPTTLPPTTVPTTTVPTTIPVLSTPEPPPPDPHAAVPVVPIGEISIPKIGVAVSFAEGVTLTVIDRGPGHWPGTAAPGGWGNVVIAAHRTSHGGPFLRIGELVPGDQIVLHDVNGTFVYGVTGIEVVTPDALWIVDQHPGRTLTLFACHPIGSASQRIVVHGELVA
jgi:sortase A